MGIMFLTAFITTAFALSGGGAWPEATPGRPELPAVAPGKLRDTPEIMAEEGIRAMKAAGVTGLCDEAFAEGKTVNNPADLRPATANFQRLHDAMTARYGKSTGEFEFIRKEAIGKTLVKFTFLEKLEKSAVVWKFAFYYVDGGWKWKDLGVTDNLEAEYRVEK